MSLRWTLHASQIQGFFDIPVDNLWSEPLMIGYIKRQIAGWGRRWDHCQSRMPVGLNGTSASRCWGDFGCLYKSEVQQPMADKLGVEFRHHSPETEWQVTFSAGAHGNPRGGCEGHRFALPIPSHFRAHFDIDLQVAILVDDMIDTGHTLTLAAKTLHERGARSIHALISHGLSISLSFAYLFNSQGVTQVFSPKQTWR